MEIWFVLAMASAILWGSSDILSKMSTPRLGVRRVAFLITPIEGAMYFMGFCVWHQNVSFGVAYGALALASCIAGTVAILCFYESIMVGQIAIAGTVSAAYPALTVVGATLILHEMPTTIDFVGLTAVIVGILALSYEPSPRSQQATPRRSLVFALFALALWGVWSLTSKIAVDVIGSGNMFGFYAISASIVPPAYIYLQGSKSGWMKYERVDWTQWLLGAVGIAVNVAGIFIFLFALNAGDASLVVPISSAYPVVTVILAVSMLHERLDKHQTVALFFTLIGLIMIGATP